MCELFGRRVVKQKYDWKYSTDKDDTYNWMINDLYRGIQTNSNYLVTLGIVVYSEAIGWHIRGENSGDRDGWNCFREFTEFHVGYNHLTSTDFDHLRNGLAHRYYSKNRRGKIEFGKYGSVRGIEHNSTDIDVYVNVYFKDFVKGVESVLDKIKSNTLVVNTLSSSSYSGFTSDFHAGRGYTGPGPRA